MASLIPGFEYDIFISYRQKDNKGERWVSEFVEALKTELASTFKEEISIYFDVNPHDGLLETHDVDASLKEKLRCAIFIPVLSRTYCDPKSFAWENEFKAFIKQASGDQFGLNVKLPNGNVASRIFPVRIHDLDAADIKLCESITGETLRDIEFIYRSAGVNRPLRSREDSPGDNMNKTFYRDQVNKTALAIKEIILGLSGEPEMTVAKSAENRAEEREFYEERKPGRSARNKLLVGAGILMILLIAGILFFPGLVDRNNLSRLIAKDGRIPIAIMPFQNMTNDTLWDVWQDGIQTIMINMLSNNRELKIRQREMITKMIQNEGVTNYASLTPSLAGLISNRLESNVYITGSLKQSGNSIRLNAQLVDTKRNEALKSFQIDGPSDSILSLTDTLSFMIQDYLSIAVMKKKMMLDVNSMDRHFNLTDSLLAFRYYMYADKAFSMEDIARSREWLLKAISADTNFVQAMVEVAWKYRNEGQFLSAKQWYLKAYSKRNLCTRMQQLLIDVLYASCFGTPDEAIKSLRKMKDLDDLFPTEFLTGVYYFQMKQYDKAIPELEKYLKDQLKYYSKPYFSSDYDYLVFSYFWTGQYQMGWELFKEAEKYYPDAPDLKKAGIMILLAEQDSIEAKPYIEKLTTFWKESFWSPARIARNLGVIYQDAGDLDKAEKYIRQSLSLEPSSQIRFNALAYFLINNDRNIKEGMGLIEKALDLNPDSYDYLHTKGWGLYKQGKYKEALNVLEKSWGIRFNEAGYDQDAYLHLEAAKKAVAGMK